LSTTAGLHVPVIPFVDVLGNVGTVPPAQMFNDVPKLNAGVILGVTLTVNVTGMAQPPAGVKVYTPEFWLLTVEGLHVPVTPFEDVVGNAGTPEPAQIVSEVPKPNTGVTFGFTVTVNVVGVAHCPAVGVNVYEPEF
jgi:hypothetical protein